MELREPGGEDGTGTGSGKESQATMLVRLAEKAGVRPFHDDRGEAWVVLPVEGHSEILRCRSKDFRRWLARLFWNHQGKAPGSDAIAGAVNVIEAQARFDGLEHALHVRVAEHDGAFWYDLSDRGWRAIRITADGWRIVSSPPVLFRRYSHQRPQVEPVGGGNLRDLLRFVNLRKPRDVVLLLVYLVSLLVPGIPHPIPILYGPQGAAKTSFLRCLQWIIDPSVMETLSTPKDPTNLVQQLSHHWVVYYDNLRALPDWLSDVFCRAVTGQGFSKRELYSDDDDVIYSFRRCLGLNGINIAAQTPDLLDRSLLFPLEQIKKCDRKPEKEFFAEFHGVVPRLLGAALDTLVVAMRLHPSVQLAELPRMADFAVWGHAIAEALGFDPAEFHASLDHNFEARNEEILQASPVAMVITAMMQDRVFWNGTATELLGTLDGLAPSLKISSKSKAWPKAPNSLTRQLNHVASNLSASGISVCLGRSKGNRTVALRRDDNDTPRDVSSPISSRPKRCNEGTYDDSDDSDDISATSRGDIASAPARDLTPKGSGNIVHTVTTVQAKQNQQLSRDDTCDDTCDDTDGGDGQTPSVPDDEACPPPTDHVQIDL